VVNYLRIATPRLGRLCWVDFELHLNNQIQGNLNLVNAVLPHFEKNGYGRIINIDTQYLLDELLTMDPTQTEPLAGLCDPNER
jgi:hypothetical protein